MVRSGLEEDLPQLDKGEFGYAVDSRRLYIGNGAVAEGAPIAGVTEILTEFSTQTILDEFNTYTYAGNSEYTPVTGEDTLHPVKRTLQARLDDYVSIKAFGATGDGSTNDLDAINRALNELYVKDNTLSSDRILFFPAGVYVISGGYVKIPSNAHIVGEGLDRTFIKQTDITQDCVAKVADTLQQVGPNLGSNSASFPANIVLVGLTLQHSSYTRNVFEIDLCDTLTAVGVKFLNTWDNGDSGFNSKSAVAITSSSSNHSKNLTFRNCTFSKIENGFLINDDSDILLIEGCRFDTCNAGIIVGDNLTGAGAHTYAAKGLRITLCSFNKIDTYGVRTYTNVHGVVSSFNYYLEVGNNNLGDLFASVPVVQFDDTGNSSIYDIFDRENSTVEKVSHDNGNVSLVPKDGLKLGKTKIKEADVIDLLDNKASAVTTGLTFTVADVPAAVINYRINRGAGNDRTGTILLVMNSSSANIDDTNIEVGTTGVTFSVTVSSGTATLKYTTTSTGTAATFTYSIQEIY